MTAQSTPAPRAAALRLAANFGESRSAVGVGSGSCELSQIVAASAGPSISGAGAGLMFGRSTVRRAAFRARAFFPVDGREAAALPASGAEPPEIGRAHV